MAKHHYEANVKLAAMELAKIPWWMFGKRRRAHDKLKTEMYYSCINEMEEHVSSGLCEGGDKCPLKIRLKS